MITNPTVLILGAGASIPFGFPSGLQLFRLVCKLQYPTEKDRQLILGAGFESKELYRFCSTLLVSGRTSVDAFLEDRKEYLDVGKAAIASCLIPFESQISMVALEPQQTFAYKGNNWYDYLFGHLTSEVIVLSNREKNISAISNNRLSILTYNYDRSLEEYFHMALLHSFNATEEEIKRVLSAIPIIHLHGNLGNLPFQGGRSRHYGPMCTQEEFDIARQGIEIIHEVDPNTPAFAKAHELLNSAEVIVFLGFGYDQQSIERLGLGPLGPKTKILGTTYGFTEREAQDLKDSFDGRLHCENLEILAFLRETGVLGNPRRHIFKKRYSPKGFIEGM